jgi:DNA mismatch endonuclease (patch repair protein)
MKPKKKYLRDGRAPIPKNEKVSRVMSANRAKNTSPEMILRRGLSANNIRGYRLHWKSAPGRPDISFPGRKIAVFVNGCFWHHCQRCKFPLPKTHRLFWEKKFLKNKQRDKSKISLLRKNDWKVLTVWEHEINNDLPKAIRKIAQAIRRS